MPILENLAVEFDGRFILMKINVDEQPELAGAFGVQSVPFVIAMVDGQPVSQLPGVVAEPELKEWLESFLPSEAVEAYNAALQLEEAGELDKACELLTEAVRLDPDTTIFQIALGRILLALDQDQECTELIERLESRGFLEPEAQQIKGQLEMKSVVEDSGGITAAKESLAADPNNSDLKVHLAEALGVEKRYAEACDLLLDVISIDRTEVRDKAKDVMVTVLAGMGPKSALAGDYRRRLATAFY
ncbi:UNVERIFIED_CONTAM: hypothetical protein GTU68_046252 [Idotea baltica]|nr:hypothetical protein [Idotea baltica]